MKRLRIHFLANYSLCITHSRSGDFFTGLTINLIDSLKMDYYMGTKWLSTIDNIEGFYCRIVNGFNDTKRAMSIHLGLLLLWI